MSNSKSMSSRCIAIQIISNCAAPASLLATCAALAMPSVLSRRGLNGVVPHHVARLAALAGLSLPSRHGLTSCRNIRGGGRTWHSSAPSLGRTANHHPQQTCRTYDSRLCTMPFDSGRNMYSEASTVSDASTLGSCSQRLLVRPKRPRRLD